MKLVDANVLLYAVNEDAPHHDESRSWLDASLSGADTVGFAWIVLLAFARISTRDGLFPRPLRVEEAFDRIDAWISARPAAVVAPTDRHSALVRDLLLPLGSGGNLVSDAHLAALAVEHRATIISWDSDFSRFPAIRWETPSLQRRSRRRR